MNSYQLFSAILSMASITISFIALLNSLYGKKISQGQIELQIYQNISESEKNLLNIMILEKDFNDKKYFSKILNVALQFNLNAYEEACSKYLDKKIDKKRFKKNYYNSIDNIVKSSTYSHFLNSNTTSYHAILKVHSEWVNLEK